LSGESAIKEITRFPVNRYYASMAACINDLDDPNKRSFVYCLIDRVLKNIDMIPPDTFLITASTKAGIDKLSRSNEMYKDIYADCLPPNIGDYISEMLSLKSNSIHISAACASSAVALAKGASLIERGRVESVLICCYDLVTEFIFSGFCALQAMSPSPCKPFDKKRKGMSLGEGAATLLIMNEEKAMEYNKKPIGILKGWAVTNDATHITRPDTEGVGLAMAIERSLNKAGIAAETVSAICAHGTGTHYNDAMEIASYKRIFGNNNIPIFSVKGAIGHTLGAAGGIEAAICLKSIMHGIIPPTTGLSDPEHGAEDFVSASPVKRGISHILSTNSGFSGVNAALIIGKGDH
jgi:3-oxoacyl-[acyl-carrier-protein] synthase II